MINRFALLDAMLFTTDEPISIEALQKNLKTSRLEVEKLLTQLREKYSDPNCGIKLSEAGGFRLVVKQEYLEKVSHLTPHADMSRGLLRVLSIIAYHEPIKQSDIVKVVGNRTYDYIKNLESRGLITSEKKSRTKMLKTTPQFEEYFGVRKGELKKLVENNEDKQA
ncbi:MAG: SMC-Scp complex subunit ScpB [Candidatus Aenigmarchaeota archaeon]|nr:SMC-Scp complex subunit ScpB [Candidatus Aenigmarchaeota archaeon]